MLDMKNFSANMKKLEAAFERQLKKETLKIFYEYLKDFSDSDFELAVDKIIKRDDVFPSIAKIRKAKKGDPGL